jgi:hypothetical protein
MSGSESTEALLEFPGTNVKSGPDYVRILYFALGPNSNPCTAINELVNRATNGESSDACTWEFAF